MATRRLRRYRVDDEFPTAAELNRIIALAEECRDLLDERKPDPIFAKWAKSNGAISARTSDLSSGSGNAVLYTSGPTGALTAGITAKVYNRAATSVADGKWIKLCWIDSAWWVDWEECPPS
jgi:hypothetical protein